MLVLPEGPYKALKRNQAIYLFLLGFLLSIGSYGAFRAYYKHSLQQQEIEKREKTIEQLKEEIEGLEAVKQEYALRVKKASDFIKRTNPSLPQETAIQYAKWEIRYAAKYNVPLSVGLAISKKESAWNKDAVSPTNPVGIKQVACRWWCEQLGITKKDLFNPKRNIEAGYQIIRIYRNQTNGWDEALASYYGSTDTTQNRQYAKKVMLVASNY